MKRLLLICAFALAGCGETPNPPEPVRSCLKQGPAYNCGRGGTCYECVEYGISCPKPLELNQQADNKLVCRMISQPKKETP
jgi:hypothetical protein